MWLVGGEYGNSIGHVCYLGQAYKWLQATEHSYSVPEDRFFLLLNTRELEQLDLNINPIYSTASFSLYGFDCYADYEELWRAEYEAYEKLWENA